MNPFEQLGRLMLALGGIVVGLGLLLLLASRFPLLGRLPGDLHLRWGNVSCFFPLVTGLVLSILATIVLNVILWLLRK
jgi:ABC-type Fe3+ transport system permease subunit